MACRKLVSVLTIARSSGLSTPGYSLHIIPRSLKTRRDFWCRDDVNQGGAICNRPFLTTAIENRRSLKLPNARRYSYIQPFFPENGYLIFNELQDTSLAGA